MKTIKLSRVPLGAVLFLALCSTTVTAEGMKCGAGKCGASMKSPMAKMEAIKSASEKFGEKKKSVEVDDFKGLNRVYEKEEYQIGTIRTH